MPDPTDIAVVIASRNRVALLRRALAALERQEAVANIEVIVVDDASEDGTEEMLRSLQRAGVAEVRSVRLDSRHGPAVARNVGWRSASSPLIAFTDDDCIPSSRWAAEIASALEDADMVQGRTDPAPDQLHRMGPFSHTMSISTASGFYETCNMGYRRELLEELDGFDEAFRHPYGEDADMGWRARSRGARFEFAANALVHHEVFPSRLWDRIRALPRLEGVVQVVSRHPALRSSLVGGLFFRRSHPPAVIAAAGLAAFGACPRRSAPALLGAVLITPYVVHRLVVEPLSDDLRRRLISLPGALLVDLVQVGVLARASLRHRTAVL